MEEGEAMKRTDFRSDKRKRDALTIHYSLPAKEEASTMLP